MRTLLTAGIVVALLAVNVQANVKVWPAVIDEYGVVVDQEILVWVENLQEDAGNFTVTLGTFDMDDQGNLLFKQDVRADEIARRYITLDTKQFSLNPNEKQALVLQVKSQPAPACYLAMFIQGRFGFVATSFVVPLLLATADAECDLVVKEVHWLESQATVVIENLGTSHGSYSQMFSEIAVDSGIILPGRSRKMVVADLALVQKLDLPGLAWETSQVNKP